MRGFAILHNGTLVCTAGMGESGLLSAMVHRLRESGNRPAECQMTISGFDVANGDFAEWNAPEINVGDEITIRIVEIAEPDPPARCRSAAEIGAGG